MRTIWKSLVQPKLDYCSQFWSPGDQDSINRIESVQRHFLSKVSSLHGFDYWEKLRKMKMYSQERRRDRYMVLFLWKISQGMVHGYDVQFTSAKGRRGRTALPHNIVSSSPAPVRKARESSLGVKGAKILVRAALCRRCLTAVGHYFAYFYFSSSSSFLLLLLFLLPPLLNPNKGIS